MTATIQTYPLVDAHRVLNDVMARLREDTTPFGQQVYDAATVVRSKMTLHWNNRLTRTAGQAKWTRQCGIVFDMQIHLSPHLLERVDEAEQIDAITHEFSHLIQAVMRGTSDHGSEWQRIHRMIGGTAAQFHQINREGLHRNRKRFVYSNPLGSRVVLTS